MTKQSFKYKHQICFDGVRGPFYSLSANINTNGFGLQDCPWGKRQSQEYRSADYVSAELSSLEDFTWLSGKLDSHLSREKKKKQIYASPSTGHARLAHNICVCVCV